MKKLISLVCAALLLCTITVTGLAANSIGDVVQPAPVANDEIPEIENLGVKKIAELVNVATKAFSVQQIVNLLNTYCTLDAASDAVTLTANSAVVSNVFPVTKDNEDGLQFGALKGANPEDFVLLVMAPQGTFAFVTLNSENVDAEGTFTGKLPFDGYAVLIRK